MNAIFQAVKPPQSYRKHPINHYATWCSWSSEFCSFIETYGGRLARKRLKVVKVPGCEPYDATYAADFSRDLDATAHEALRSFAASLLEMELEGRLILLTDMMQRGIDSRMLHVIFVLLRSSLINLTGDGRSALVSPVKTQRKDPGFALHADLFLTERLMLVFDDVPGDGSGRSLFLSYGALMEALEETPSVSAATRAKAHKLMTGKLRRDSFDELFALLHSADNPWQDDLKKKLSERQFALSLAPGQGYLLNDRQWLHGREAVQSTTMPRHDAKHTVTRRNSSAASAPQYAVSSRRFRRLAFG